MVVTEGGGGLFGVAQGRLICDWELKSSMEGEIATPVPNSFSVIALTHTAQGGGGKRGTQEGGETQKEKQEILSCYITATAGVVRAPPLEFMYTAHLLLSRITGGRGDLLA